MSIVLIGGHDRMHRDYKEICKKRGHNLKVYTQRTIDFAKAIGHPDGIVLFTSTVSHQMVRVAVKVAKNKNIPLLRSHCSSATSLGEILMKLETQKL